MQSKPEGCVGCPLYDKGKGFVPDKLARHPKYVLIGEAPGKNEIVEGEPFIGKAGFVLKQWLIRQVPLLQVAMDRDEVTLANTLRCLPPEVQGRPYPKGQERLDAESRCRQYDNFGDAHTILLFGEAPQRVQFGSELDAEDSVDKALGHSVKGVMGRIGRVYEREGKRWVFAPHPAFILRQPALVSHGQQACKIAVNDTKELLPLYTPWELALEALS